MLKLALKRRRAPAKRVFTVDDPTLRVKTQETLVEAAQVVARYERLDTWPHEAIVHTQAWAAIMRRLLEP